MFNLIAINQSPYRLKRSSAFDHSNVKLGIWLGASLASQVKSYCVVRLQDSQNSIQNTTLKRNNPDFTAGGYFVSFITELNTIIYPTKPSLPNHPDLVPGWLRYNLWC